MKQVVLLKVFIILLLSFEIHSSGSNELGFFQKFTDKFAQSLSTLKEKQQVLENKIQNATFDNFARAMRAPINSQKYLKFFGKRAALVAGVFLVGKTAFDSYHHMKETKGNNENLCMTSQSYVENLNKYADADLADKAAKFFEEKKLDTSDKKRNPVIFLILSYLSFKINDMLNGMGNLLNSAVDSLDRLSTYLAVEAARSATCDSNEPKDK